MKYGLIANEPIENRNEKFVNMGGPIQVHSIHQIYRWMGIPDSQITYISLNRLKDYRGEHILLPVNMNLSNNWVLDVIPFSSYIIPVFIGLSFFSAIGLTQEEKDYFRLYSPVGCRDEATVELMRENNIPAFLTGCVTLSLPKYIGERKRNKIFLVDVPQEVIKYIPDKLKDNTDVVKLSHIMRCMDEDVNQKAVNLLGMYAREGKLVITSRLHCMAPCMAMGVPVVALVENCSDRYSFIDRFIDIYTYKQMSEIKWDSFSVIDEKVKDDYRAIVKGMILSTAEKYQKICEFSQFYEDRTKAVYNSFYLDKLKIAGYRQDDEFEYAIWGTGQIGMGVYRTLKRYYKNARLTAAIDSYCQGDFFECNIVHYDSFDFDKSAVIFIASHSGEQEIRNILNQRGYTEGEDFVSFATFNG